MNIAKMLQQAQKAQAELQKSLGELEVEGSAGGGIVRLRINGLRDLKGVHIDTQALAGEEASLLEDLVMAAWDEAVRVLEERTQEIMRRSGLPPGLGSLG